MHAQKVEPRPKAEERRTDEGYENRTGEEKGELDSFQTHSSSLGIQPVRCVGVPPPDRACAEPKGGTICITVNVISSLDDGADH